MKPVLSVLHGQRRDPPPVWLMRQAGRYLPEYRAARARVPDLLTAFLDPALATEITLQPVHRYGVDAAILYSDILILPWAVGRDLRFEEGLGPRMTPMDLSDIDRLPKTLPNLVGPVLQTLRNLSTEMPSATTLIGFAGSPFTVACYMVDGKGGGEFPRARHMAHAEPEAFGQLVDRLTELTAEYLVAQIDAGAEAVMLFDSWAGLLPPPLFERYVIVPTARIAAVIGGRAKLIGFPRLAGVMLPRYARETGVACVALDTTADPATLDAQLPPGLAIQGNLDPAALIAGGTALERAVRPILAALKQRPHILNLGHGITPECPPEHVAELLRLVRGAGIATSAA